MTSDFNLRCSAITRDFWSLRHILVLCRNVKLSQQTANSKISSKVKSDEENVAQVFFQHFPRACDFVDRFQISPQLHAPRCYISTWLNEMKKVSRLESSKMILLVRQEMRALQGEFLRKKESWNSSEKWRDDRVNLDHFRSQSIKYNYACIIEVSPWRSQSKYLSHIAHSRLQPNSAHLRVHYSLYRGISYKNFSKCLNSLSFFVLHHRIKIKTWKSCERGENQHRRMKNPLAIYSFPSSSSPGFGIGACYTFFGIRW